MLGASLSSRNILATREPVTRENLPQNPSKICSEEKREEIHDDGVEKIESTASITHERTRGWVLLAVAGIGSAAR